MMFGFLKPCLLLHQFQSLVFGDLQSRNTVAKLVRGSHPSQSTLRNVFSNIFNGVNVWSWGNCWLIVASSILCFYKGQCAFWRINCLRNGCGRRQYAQLAFSWSCSNIQRGLELGEHTQVSIESLTRIRTRLGSPSARGALQWCPE